MRKILISLGMIVFVGGLVAGATGAFFSDTETSTGNTFAAGAIDLGIDNESYYNGVLNNETTWGLDFDIDNEKLLFNFTDLKPGDYGEDTISLHVTNNESWLCADVSLDSNDDATCTEPENDIEGSACDPQTEPDQDPTDGDLAQNLYFLWWADDGDNVLEEGERVLPGGPIGALSVGATTTVALADSDENIWGGTDPILTDDPSEILYVGKAWCFGSIAPQPLAQSSLGVRPTTTPAGNGDGNQTAGQPTDGGYTCDGVSIGNEAQTDVAKMSVAFRAVQARNNGDFQCTVPPPTSP